MNGPFFLTVADDRFGLRHSDALQLAGERLGVRRVDVDGPGDGDLREQRRGHEGRTQSLDQHDFTPLFLARGDHRRARE